MQSSSSPTPKDQVVEEASGSDTESRVTEGMETDRFGFLLRNGFTAESEGPLPELVRQREAKWINLISQWDRVLQKKTSKVKEHCQKGIPASLRAKCWPLLCGATDKMNKNNDLYKSLDSKQALQSWVDMIERDLDRQFPFHEMFVSKDGHGQRGLFRVLKAFTQYQPEEGYCQAQGPVAAVLLMNMPAEEAFWCLVQISEQYLPGYYSPLLEGVLFDAAILTWVLKRACPAAQRHLQKHGVEPLMFATDWLMCLYTRHLPFNTLLRVWDLFFCYGVRVLFQVAVVLVRRVLGRAEQRKECQGQMETLEKLRSIREEVQQEDNAFISEVCSVRLSGRDLERQTERELEKWKKDRPSSTFDPRGRCYGYRMAWEKARQKEAERDRKERQKGNLSLPLLRSPSSLSLSPSLLRKRWTTGRKTSATAREERSEVEEMLRRESWMDSSPAMMQGVLEEEEKVFVELSVPLGDRKPKGGPPPSKEKTTDTGQPCQAPDDPRKVNEPFHEHGATLNDPHKSPVPVLQSSRNDQGQVAGLRSVTIEIQEEKDGRSREKEYMKGTHTVIKTTTEAEAETEAGAGTKVRTEAGTGPEAVTGQEAEPEAVTGQEAEPEVGTAHEAGPEAGTRQEAGSEAGTRQEVRTGQVAELEAGKGPEAEAGTRQEERTGQEAELEAGTGPEAGSETGTRQKARTGEEAETEVVTRPETGTGQEAGTEVVTRPETGTGQEAGTEVVTRPETGTGQEAGTEVGTKPEAGTAQETETEVGTKPEAGTAQETETEVGTRPEAGTVQEAGTGQEAETEVGTGEGIGSGSENLAKGETEVERGEEAGKVVEIGAESETWIEVHARPRMETKTETEKIDAEPESGTQVETELEKEAGTEIESERGPGTQLEIVPEAGTDSEAEKNKEEKGSRQIESHMVHQETSINTETNTGPQRGLESNKVDDETQTESQRDTDNATHPENREDEDQELQTHTQADTGKGSDTPADALTDKAKTRPVEENLCEEERQTYVQAVQETHEETAEGESHGDTETDAVEPLETGTRAAGERAPTLTGGEPETGPLSDREGLRPETGRANADAERQAEEETDVPAESEGPATTETKMAALQKLETNTDLNAVTRNGSERESDVKSDDRAESDRKCEFIEHNEMTDRTQIDTHTQNETGTCDIESQANVQPPTDTSKTIIPEDSIVSLESQNHASVPEPDGKCSSAHSTSPMDQPGSEEGNGQIVSIPEDKHQNKRQPEGKTKEEVFELPIQNASSVITQNISPKPANTSSPPKMSPITDTRPESSNPETLAADQPDSLSKTDPLHRFPSHPSTSGELRLRKSPSSRGTRPLRRLSEDLFTAPQLSPPNKSNPTPTVSKQSQLTSPPVLAHSNQAHPKLDPSISETHLPDRDPTHPEPASTQPSALPPCGSNPALPDQSYTPWNSASTPRRFGLFRRLRGEPGRGKVPVPTILIQDFSDSPGEQRTVDEGEEKLSSKERRKRRREQERREKEEEKLRKKKEAEKRKERRKPQTRGKSFQGDKSSSDVRGNPSQTLGPQKHSYAEAYF